MQFSTFTSVEEIAEEKLAVLVFLRDVPVRYYFWLTAGIFKGNFPYTHLVFLLNT